MATLTEVGRVLVPRGVLGALWSGPDPEGPFLAQARALLAGRSEPTDDPTSGAGAGDPQAEFGDLILGDASRPTSTLEIPEGMPFEPPEHEVFTWDLALDADDLIGLLGTFSWIITMPDDTRRAVIAEARRLLAELLGVRGRRDRGRRIPL